MRCRIVCRDCAPYSRADLGKVNHVFDVQIVFGDQPIGRGNVTLLELPPDWKPREWLQTLQEIATGYQPPPPPTPVPQDPVFAPYDPISQTQPSLPPIPPPVAEAASVPRGTLSPREQEVHDLHTQGKSYEEIAATLGFKSTTAKTYAIQARRKLRAGPAQPAA